MPTKTTRLTLAFETLAPRVQVARAQVQLRSVYGDTFACALRLRIDGRDGLYRVDMADGPLGLPIWEAIDQGRGFRRVRDARAYARRYALAVAEQQTMHPRNVERPDAQEVA